MTSSVTTPSPTTPTDVITLDGSFPGSREVLGGKAYSVNRMQAMGLPVPPAFALPTHVCGVYHSNAGALPEPIWQSVLEHLRRLETETGRTFGSGPSPLLVSVRSGAAQSMPGMMDTVLNLGLTPELCDALAEETGDREWADDTWQRFRHSYATIVVGDATAEPPHDPFEQLRAAIGAVFDSWTNDRVKAYRARHNLGTGAGTAVTVQAMVFGNRDDRSGTGVMFSRNPATGENLLYGEWLTRAQGEDVVSGEKTPASLTAVSEVLPDIYPQLEQVASVLEQEHRDLVDIEFTVESGRLYVLQCRAGKRSARAAVRIAVDLVRENIIDRTEAVIRISADQAAALVENHGVHAHHPVLATGVGAGPGTAVGQAVGDIDEARTLADAGTPVVLVRPSTAPDDVPAMFESVAVVTELGGSTSHAALVCREIGLPCVVGAGLGAMAKLVGRTVTVDGVSGTVYDGDALNAHGGEPDEYLGELLDYLPDPIPADHVLAPLAAAYRDRD
ncbi:pyruvate, phosphate dikinase [Rhodococcus pyridinivorans]|uniref:pyruvate, phosphate dikinase n=1 Tax=Rhodococcus pyridinivorans TaxID=103816 RepID=UPI0022839148|nr:pyruvate, phosphate dikinase [Rhodococcus pyridinivorans]WAL49281.1 pyruvate, phosphate dikinase [Rhodococcus pyridinivorans]